MSQSGELEHGPDCECPRCTGFLPGNDLAVGHGHPAEHGAYVQVLKLASRVAEIADALRLAMPHSSPVFEAAVQTGAIAGARLERAMVALETAKPGELARLEQDARGWHRAYMGALDRLGLTPMSASKLGLNLTIAGSVREALVRRYSTPPDPDPAGVDGDA